MIILRRLSGSLFFFILLILFYLISGSIHASFILLLSGFLFILSNSTFSNNYSPITLFTAGWVLPSIFIVFLNRHEKYIGWQVNEILWITVLLSTLGFVIGVLVVFIFRFHQLLGKNSLKELTKKIQLNDYRQSISHEKIGVYKIIHVFSFLGLIGFANNLINIIRAGGLSVIAELGLRDSERIFGQSTIINYLYFLNPLAFVLSISFLTRYGANNRIRLIAIITFLTLFFHGTRSTIIYPFIMAALSYMLLTDKKIKLIQIIGGCLFFVIGFQLVTIGRNFPYMPSDATLFEILTYRIEDIFLYFTPAYSNLQAEIINLKSLRYGEESFQFINGLFSFITGTKDGIENTRFDSEQFYLVHESFNTGTFLRENYRDFGFGGVFFFSLFYGILASFFYFNLLLYPTIKNVISYSIICIMLLVCFFSNQFFKIQYWYWVVILFISFSIQEKRTSTKIT